MRIDDKLKKFINENVELIDAGMFSELLDEANSADLTNDDIHTLIELFKTSKVPITEQHLLDYLDDKIQMAVASYTAGGFPYRSISGYLDFSSFFRGEDLHVAGYSWEDFGRYMDKNWQRFGLKKDNWIII